MDFCGRIDVMEGYPSGRRGLIANELVRGNLERGFKSLTLRQNRLIRACSYQAILKEGQGITKFFLTLRQFLVGLVIWTKWSKRDIIKL